LPDFNEGKIFPTNGYQTLAHADSWIQFTSRTDVQEHTSVSSNNIYNAINEILQYNPNYNEIKSADAFQSLSKGVLMLTLSIYQLSIN